MPGKKSSNGSSPNGCALPVRLCGRNYKGKTIRVIVGGRRGPGGALDVKTRAMDPRHGKVYSWGT